MKQITCAVSIAERIRTEISSLKWEKINQVTISLGVTQHFRSFPESFFEFTDENLVVGDSALFKKNRNFLAGRLQALVKSGYPQGHKIFIKGHIRVFFEKAAHMLRAYI